MSKQDWLTPQWLFDFCDRRWGPLRVDVAANSENAHCRAYVDEREDALSVCWERPWFCNPPYRHYRQWVEHALKQPAPGVMIGPAGTNTKWFHQCWSAPHVSIWLPNQRIAFIDGDNPERLSPKHETAILVFGHGSGICTLDVRGELERRAA